MPRTLRSLFKPRLDWLLVALPGDGRSNWFQGVLLIAVWVILGMVFYFLPA